MIRVLIADDEGIERMALCRRLGKHFGDTLRICQAEDGAEAVELFKREKSQIVIMDIAMPVLNGVEAAEQIRRLDEGCVIIFLTAYDEFSYAKRALVIRALDYLLKPCEEDELVAVMEEAVRLAGLYAQGRQAGYFRPAGPENAQVRDGEERGESGENPGGRLYSGLHPPQLHEGNFHAGRRQGHELLGRLFLQAVQTVF